MGKGGAAAWIAWILSLKCIDIERKRTSNSEKIYSDHKSIDCHKMLIMFIWMITQSS